MNVDVLKDVLSKELFEQVQEATKETEGRLADIAKGGFVSNDKYSALETQLANTQQLLETKNKDFDELKGKAGDNEALKGQIDDLKTKYEQEKTQLTAQYEEKLKKNTVATRIMNDYKPKDVDDVMAHIDLSKVTVADESITGLSEQVEALKKSKAYYFEDDTPEGATGLEHNGGSSKDLSAIRRAMGLKDKS